MNILFLGDIYGKPGRKIVKSFLPDFIQNHKVDFCIANCENLCDGKGVSESSIKEMLDVGINIFSSGNHLFDRKESNDFVASEKNIARPLNYPKDAPGNKYILYKKDNISVLLLTLCGQAFMNPVDSPFTALENFLENFPDLPRIIIVDFHAESTAEKKTFGYYFDGRVTAILGTHTHVQTADETILENGTGYITDVGMCGAHDSIIGVRKEEAFHRVRTNMPVRHITAEEGLKINAVLLEIDELTGKTMSIRRIKC